MTFKEKLEKFKRERVGFRVSSEEIAEELTKVFERNHIKPREGGSLADVTVYAWRYAKEDSYVTYNYHKGEHKLSYGRTFLSGSELVILDVTLEELKAYNG